MKSYSPHSQHALLFTDHVMNARAASNEDKAVKDSSEKHVTRKLPGFRGRWKVERFGTKFICGRNCIDDSVLCDASNHP